MHKLLSLLIFLLMCFSGCVNLVVVPYSPTFIVTPTTTGNCAWDRGENFSILILTNGTELVNWSDTYITFNINANVPDGATKNDRITIYFEVTDYDTQIFKYNGAYQIKWSVANDSFWYVKGSETFPYRRMINLSLEFDFNVYEIALITYSNLTINFHNKENTWNKQYRMKFVAVDISD